MLNRLHFNVEVKSLKEGEFEVIASNAKVDRFGDTINPDGWDLRNYRKNPVILWSHSSGGFGEAAVPPIARATRVWIEDKKLKVKGIFAPTPFAQELRELVEQGFLNAVSVGFIPLVEDEKGDMEIDTKMYRRANEEELKGCVSGGTKFEKQELLEVSWVSVPALPSALVTAKEMGLQLLTKELEVKKVEKESKEDYHTCKCGSKEIETLSNWPAGGMGVFTTATISIQRCKTCGRFRRIQGDAGAPMKLLEEFETKVGRVISEKNRKLINKCITEMGIAIDVLKVLLTATEPEKDIAPIEAKGRGHDKMKERVSPELRLMRKANKAVDNALRKLKESGSGSKTKIQILRLASKAIEAVIIKAKANK